MKRQRKADRRSTRQAGSQAKRETPRVQCAVSSLLKDQIVAEQVSDRKSPGDIAVQSQQEPEVVTGKPDSPGYSVSSTNGERLPQSCDHLGDHQTPTSTDSALVLSRSDAVPTPDQKGVAEAAELQGLGSSLKVTIQREGDSRAFGKTAGQTEGQTQGHHCHLCSSSCPTLQAFQNHMMGTEHQKRLKEITQLVKTAGSRVDQPIKSRWCDTCQKHFTGDVILHRRTNRHKLCKQSSRPYCLVCKRHFRTPRKFVEHMKSPEHKEKVHLEEEEELITVDAIGCFEGEERLAEEAVVDEEVEAGKGDEDTRGGGEETLKGEETEKQEFDPDTIYGSSFVVPVTGFLCRLCQKFFDNEATARHTHCRTHTHYLNLQMHTKSENHGNLTHEHTSLPPDVEHKHT